MATDPHYQKITVEEFLQMDFGDKKVELDDGVIVAMTGASGSHNRVQANLMRFLGQILRGSGCRPFGSDQGLRTAGSSTRYPDVAIYCGDMGPGGRDQRQVFEDPKVIFEVLSPSTYRHDEGTKLLEYQQLESVDTIVFVDPDVETVRIVQRLGPTSWRNELFPRGVDAHLPSLGITIPKQEIFARD
jgi:Uma2 family endonuclease